MNQKAGDKVDLFAKIVTEYQQRWDSDLIEPGPPKLPKRYLPAGVHNPQAEFKPTPRLDNPEKLHRELIRQRRAYSPFLRDLAPRVRSTRKTIALKEFDWREENVKDQQDFRQVLDGKGRWQKVHIPHYGGPLGKAVTYYRTTFSISRAMFGKNALFMCFEGVDYKSHVFINDSYLGSHEGFFAPFEFDFSRVAHVGKNTLVIKVENDAICLGNDSWGTDGDQYEGDKLYAATGPGYDDPEVGWHHCPPGMGIYQGVYVESRPAIHVHDIFVRPVVEEQRAEAWIEINSCHLLRQRMALEISVFGQNFPKTVFTDLKYSPSATSVPGLGDLSKPGDRESQELLLGPGVNYFKISFAMPKPRLWQPDSPWLYQLQVKVFDEKNKVVDTAQKQFGMRSFRMEEKEEPKGRFYLNGRPIRLRGANTMGHLQQCVIKENWGQLRDDILLAKICHMNFLRLTQCPTQKVVYDYCDRLGLMTQTDLPLFGCLRRNQFNEAVKQAREMEHLIRSHPCNILVSYINEPFPNGNNKPHRHLTHEEMSVFFAAADSAVRLENPDRVTKAVDGNYDPPSPGLPCRHCYNGWYIGHGLDMGKHHKGYWQRIERGWNYSCGEFGAEGLDPVEVMRKYYPRHWLPQNSAEERTWTPDKIIQAQTGLFHYMWFETQHTLEAWVRFSQNHQKWVVQMMTEAFRRDPRVSSNAVHLFIDAFPSGWMKAIMDVDRRPKPAYFAYRDALAPLLVHGRTDRFTFFAGEPMPLEVWICNDRSEKSKKAFLHYQMELGGRVIFAQKTTAQIPVCSSQFQGFLKLKAPEVGRRTKVTVRLALKDEKGTILNENSIDLNIFPAVNVVQSRTAYIIGSKKCPATRLAGALGMKMRFSGEMKMDQVILIDDLDLFKRKQREVFDAVKKGGTAVFMPLSVGRHKIAGGAVEVSRCGMGSRHFVDRNTGNALVKGFEPDDFKFWFDSDRGYVTPFLHTTFFAEGFESVLTSGSGVWCGRWFATLAAAQKSVGQGVIRICQLELANRVRGNPVAMVFGRRLLGIEDSE